MPSKSSLLDTATAAINSEDPQADDNLRIDRLPEVMNLTGLSRPTIYSLQAQDKFPKSIDLGSRAIGWIHSEIMGWIRDRIRQSRAEKKVPARKLPKGLREQNHNRSAPAPGTAQETTSPASSS